MNPSALDRCPRCGNPRDALAHGLCPACLAACWLAPDPGEEAATADAPPGRWLGGYELLEELGRGGMGVVFRARQPGLDRDVAVKLLRDAAFAGEPERRRFQAEAASAARLNHPHIVAIYEVGTADGQPFLVMERVAGRNLADVTRDGPLPSRRAAEIAAQLADAVQHAHARGVLHRDLKPSNVLLDAAGAPRLTDFGLARPLDTDSSLTLTGQVLGTPGYLAPEQARGAAGAGPAADVYGLGALLFHLLTGRAPFVAAGAAEALAQVLHEEPLSPRLLNPAVPSDLAAVCLRCLHKEPGQRYPSAGALAEDLRRFLEGRPTLARPAGPLGRVGRWARRRPALAAALAAAGAMALAGVSGITWQWRRAVAANLRAQAATHDKQEQLWRSQLIEARYFRTSGEPGQRRRTLEVVAEAARWRPSVDLRTEAAAALLRPDLGPAEWFHETRYGHWPLAFTGGLEFYAPFSASGRVAVLSAVDHAVVVELPPGRGHTLFLKFSPDDCHLGVHFEDGAVRVWDWRAGRLVVDVPAVADEDPGDPGDRGGLAGLPAFDFTADGTECLVGCRGRPVRRFALADGRELPAPVPATERADAVLLHPRGRWLAVARGQQVELWEDGVRRDAYEALDTVNVLAWHPHEPWLAVGALTHELQLKEPGQPAVSFPAEEPRITWTAFSPDGDLLITGGWADGTVFWDIVTRKPVLTARDGFPRQLSHDGQRLAFARERIGFGVRPVDWPVGLRRLVPPAAFGIEASGSRFSRDGRWLATGHPHGLLLWNPAQARLMQGQHTESKIMPAAFLPGDTALLTSGFKGAQRWPLVPGDPDTAPAFGNPEWLLPPELRLLNRVALAPDGHTLAFGGDNGLVLAALDRPGEIVPLAGPERPVHYLDFTGDGRWLVTGYYHTTDGVEVYDVAQRRHAMRLPTGGHHFFLNPDGTRLLAHSPAGYGVWTVGEWERQLFRDGGGPDAPRLDAAGFSPDGRLMFFNASSGHLHLRGAADDTALLTLIGFDTTGAWGLVSRPDGRLLVDSSSRRAVNLWDLPALQDRLAEHGLGWVRPP